MLKNNFLNIDGDFKPGCHHVVTFSLNIKRLSDDEKEVWDNHKPAICQMAVDVISSDAFNAIGTDCFMNAANKTFNEKTGDHGRLLGTISGLILKLLTSPIKVTDVEKELTEEQAETMDLDQLKRFILDDNEEYSKVWEMMTEDRARRVLISYGKNVLKIR